MIAKERRCAGLVDLARRERHREHVDLAVVGRHAITVQGEEEHRGDDRRAFVAVDEGVVAGEAEGMGGREGIFVARDRQVLSGRALACHFGIEKSFKKAAIPIWPCSASI